MSKNSHALSRPQRTGPVARLEEAEPGADDEQVAEVPGEAGNEPRGGPAEQGQRVDPAHVGAVGQPAQAEGAKGEGDAEGELDVAVLPVTEVQLILEPLGGQVP